MIELHIVIKTHAKETRAITQALQALGKSIQSIPGCISVEIYKRVGAPCTVCYDEIWASESALQQMITTKHFSQLASLMECASETPNCEFRFISEIQGLEFAEQVRNRLN